MFMGGVEEFAETIGRIWNTSHAQQILLRQWQVAEGSQIGNQNGKMGCAAVRLINILGPGGKVLLKELWAAASPPRLKYAYGFIAVDGGNKRYSSCMRHDGSYDKWG